MPTAAVSSEQTMEQFNQYVIPNYRRYPVCLVRGEGSFVWDAEGLEELNTGTLMLVFAGLGEFFGMDDLADVVNGGAEANCVGVELCFGEFRGDTLHQRAGCIVHEDEVGLHGPLRPLHDHCDLYARFGINEQALRGPAPVDGRPVPEVRQDGQQVGVANKGLEWLQFPSLAAIVMARL